MSPFRKVGKQDPGKNSIFLFCISFAISIWVGFSSITIGVLMAVVTVGIFASVIRGDWANDAKSQDEAM